MPVGEMLERYSSAELTELQLYERIEPYGEAAADDRGAILAMLVASVWGGGKSKVEDYKLHRADIPEQTAEQQWQALVRGCNR